MNARLTLAVLAGAIALATAAPVAAQARSNIQDDPKSSSCTENCVDAGYEWAIANTPADDAECGAKNEDFAAGCAHWLQEQRDAAAPPPEEPMEAAAAEGEAPPADDSAAPADDSAAPPPEEPADPPSNQ